MSSTTRSPFETWWNSLGVNQQVTYEQAFLAGQRAQREADATILQQQCRRLAAEGIVCGPKADDRAICPNCQQAEIIRTSEDGTGQ